MEALNRPNVHVKDLEKVRQLLEKMEKDGPDKLQVVYF